MPARPTTLSILIIDENRLRASVIEAGLREAGYDNLTLIHDVTGIARRIADVEPDVIFIDLENPNRDMLENIFQLSRAVQRPIAMFVDRSDQAAIEAAVDAGVSAYVVDGLKKRTRQADPRHGHQPLQRLLAHDARTGGGALGARGPQAHRPGQGDTHATRGLTEADAYGLLRKTAMNQNRKIAEIAESLITAAGLLAPPEDKEMTADHQIVAGFMPLLDSAMLVAARRRALRGRRHRPRPGARDVVGQHPRPHGGRPLPGGAHARADADRLQPRADAARDADHRADGARPRRQRRHGVERPVGGHGRCRARRRTSIRPPTGAALQQVVAGGFACRSRLRFAVVHPYSGHNYELRYWLAACGIDPGKDVEIVIVPPPLMADALGQRRHRRLLRRRAMEQRGGAAGVRAHRHRQGRHLALEPGKGARA